LKAELWVRIRQVPCGSYVVLCSRLTESESSRMFGESMWVFEMKIFLVT